MEVSQSLTAEKKMMEQSRDIVKIKSAASNISSMKKSKSKPKSKGSSVTRGAKSYAKSINSQTKIAEEEP